MTKLRWCELCGEDMHEKGGKRCKYCLGEYCLNCFKRHVKHCLRNPNRDEDYFE